MITHKILKKLNLEGLWDKYQCRSAYSYYETRNCKDFQIPRLITEHAKKDFTSLPLRLGTISQSTLETTKYSGTLEKTRSAPEELRMQITSKSKHNPLEEHNFLFFVGITCFAYHFN